MPTVSVNLRTRRTVNVAVNQSPTVTTSQSILQATLNDLLDVDTGALPQPYPGDLVFSEDERYTLVWDPDTQQWIAALEPVITAIDGGTY